MKRGLWILLAAVCLVVCLAFAACGPREPDVVGVDSRNENNDNVNPESSGNETTVAVTVIYHGNPMTEYYPEGQTVYFAGVYYGQEVSLDQNFATILSESDGVTVRSGMTIYVREKGTTPAEVTVTYYDVATDGNLQVFERVSVRYGSSMRFDGSGFVLYSDPACLEEI
ncbi:MAG: hypothetical protein II797_04230, partial [Clostridia bacterium]|nr:hypothetical protein [Clostridia bacterium]